MEAVCALMDDYSREVQALANNEVIKAEEIESLQRFTVILAHAAGTAKFIILLTQ